MGHSGPLRYFRSSCLIRSYGNMLLLLPQADCSSQWSSCLQGAIQGLVVLGVHARGVSPTTEERRYLGRLPKTASSNKQANCVWEYNCREDSIRIIVQGIVDHHNVPRSARVAHSRWRLLYNASNIRSEYQMPSSVMHSPTLGQTFLGEWPRHP